MKVGLLAAAGLTEFRFASLGPIIEDDSYSIELAIIYNKPKKVLGQRLKRNFKRHGLYTVVIIIKQLLARRRRIYSTKELCAASSIDILETNDPYSTEVMENIRSHKLDILLLVGSYGIVKEPLLSITPMGILSYHHGNMRKYRGRPVGFWELYNNDSEMGVTVQILEAGLDSGIPVEEKIIPIRANETLDSLTKRAYRESSALMSQALKKISNPGFVPEKIETFGKLYTLPSFGQWVLLKMKVLWRRMRYFFSAGTT